ncbi:cytochrome c oxidase assembly protein subunit 15 [Microbacterium azadirachtae]|nr:cytochrome c oxidase assembly protein subunit 15 [Microbacterium azadirachtae]SEF52946.1 cytochrome c oxidase assembly protein subunit 15 [Microbacterium azadirachtae]SEF53151.1 cytochrome c oxidase assembly protein subunit 15 [Microbacterium azadirachtae]
MPEIVTPPAPRTRPGFLGRVHDWLPDRVDLRVKIAAWVSFVLEVAIVGTGGAVRLTDSGLGCEWPLCTPDSLFPTAEQSYHSLIEFGNRGLSFFVGLAAIAVIVLISRFRAERRDLWTMAWIVFAGVLVQAAVGGILVIFHLHPNMVAFHYLVSLVLVAVSAAFLVRMGQPSGPRERAVPKAVAILVHITSFVLALTVIFGVLTTGAGPHSGDPAVTLRNGFDATVLEHVHSWPAYALFGLTLALLVISLANSLTVIRSAVIGLLAIELVQIAVGLYQARNALPPLAVGVHMVLAAVLVAACTVLVLRVKSPAEQAPLPADAGASS